MRVAVALFLMGVMAGCSKSEATSEVAAPPPIYVATVIAEALVPTTAATAEVLANRQAVLRAETAGRVVSVSCEPGQRVEAGEVMLRLDVGRSATAVQAARASEAEAEARLSQASRELERTRPLVKSGGLADQRLDEAKDAVRLATAALDAARAQARLSRRGVTEAIVRAPFSGTVVERTAELGEYVTPGTPLAVLADRSRLKARVLLDPREALDVQIGATAQVTAYARPGEVFAAHVTRVGDVIDPSTRRLPVEIEIDDPDDRLRPGLVARFEVTAGEAREALLVPQSAVFERFDRHHVYVIKDGRAERRAVHMGSVFEDRVELRGGIEAGETIAVEGVARIVHGEPVRVVESMAERAIDQNATAEAAP